MAFSNPKKATVTPLDSLFSPEETEKASKRVQEAIADRRNELDRVQTFAADNSALIKLVRQLPDQVSHEIMVPFGGAAFFPGRLIHTNEFLVLLGDNYYAERSSKQTVDILKRRDKALEAQVEALKASMTDLEAEAKFFDTTAAEAKEGLVEIIEEYEEPQNNELASGVPDSSYASSSTVDKSIALDKEKQYAQMMARLDELEKEELEAESDKAEDDEQEDSEDNAEDALTESDEVEELEFGEDEDSLVPLKNYINDNKIRTTEKNMPQIMEHKSHVQEIASSSNSTSPVSGSHLHHPESTLFSNLSSQLKAKDGSGRSNREWSHTTINPPMPSEAKEDPLSFAIQNCEDVSEDNAVQYTTRERKSFTGSVIERTHGLPSNEPTQDTTSDKPLKPVSRFKMQRANR